MSEWLSEPVRAWLYRIASALVPLLVLAGWLAEDVAQQVLEVVAAVLGMGAAGMAARHTRTKRQRQRQRQRQREANR